MSTNVSGEVQLNANPTSAPDHYHNVEVQGSIGFDGNWVLRKFFCDGTGDTIHLERRLDQEFIVEAAEPAEEESKPVLASGPGWVQQPPNYVAPKDWDANVPKRDLNVKGPKTRAASRQTGPSGTRAQSNAASLTARKDQTRDHPTVEGEAAHSASGSLPKRKRSESAIRTDDDSNALNVERDEITAGAAEDQAAAQKGRAKRPRAAAKREPKTRKSTKKTTSKPTQELKKSGKLFQNLSPAPETSAPTPQDEGDQNEEDEDDEDDDEKAKEKQDRKTASKGRKKVG